jgi:7-cyano-7-deazaguanine reductase
MKLAEWLKQNSVTADDFAARISVNRLSVYRYQNGERVPNKELMRRIFEQTHGSVTANDFYDIPEPISSQFTAAPAPSSLQLGRPVPLPASPAAAKLDRVPNPHPDTDYVARFTAPEFTCLCPITGQPDFAHFVIDYAPGRWLLESKSLKLYLASFRNHGAFHEDCTVAIGKRLAGLLRPKWLRIGGYWYPRGGIPIDVFWQTGRLPRGVWLPDPGVAPYRGRG